MQWSMIFKKLEVCIEEHICRKTQRKDPAQCWPRELAVTTAVPGAMGTVTRSSEPLQCGLCDGRSECSFLFISLAVASLSSGYPVGWPRKAADQT